MKIATMATGGIGGYLAVKLTQAGHDVACIARGEHLAAIRENGLTLQSHEGRETERPWMATDDPAQVGPVDAIIFGVKGDGLPDAARACLPMLGPDTVVVPFLNGVEASDRLMEILPQQHIATGVAKISTTISAPGLISQVGQFSSFIFAERDSRPSARIKALQDAINQTSSSAPHTDDVQRELWWKFVLFSAASGITAAGRCRWGDIRSHPALTKLCQDVIAETAALGRARGVALEPSVEEDVWATMSKLPAEGRASTAIDLEHGRPLEVEWVSGAVVRLAAQTGVPVPMNAALYALLQPYRNGPPA